MRTDIQQYIRTANHSRSLRNRLKAVLPILSIVVIIAVFWWLKLIGITLAGDAFCGKAEHSHNEECCSSLLICEEEHEHTNECYETTYVCGLEEHIHEAMCYSNITADVETPVIWEESVSEVKLTGTYADDIVAIAESQLGYAESELNFYVGDDGIRRGYTRYGEWYGNPYGDWSAMFALFCFNYAEVPSELYPANSGAESMRLAWEEAGLISSDTEAIKGDLLFLDTNTDGAADKIAIVKASDGEQLSVIMGDHEDAVGCVDYNIANEYIIGIGSIKSVISQTLTESDKLKIDTAIAEIDALPSADEVEAKLAEYEEAEDYEGYQAYFEDTAYLVSDAYLTYSLLSGNSKTFVTNADKLADLDWIRSAPSLMIEEIRSDNVTEVESASTSDFIEINLYDYGSNLNTKYNSNNKYPGFQWNGGAYMKSTTYDRHTVDFIDFGNSVITDLVYGEKTKIGNQGGLINKLDVSDYGVTNRPIGFSIGTEVMQRSLKSGYPALVDGTSLSYLFSDGTYADKQNTSNIDGLFKYNEETGLYSFNSRENHAQYSNNKFTLYEQIITPNFIIYPFGNFLPFNDITNKSDATQVSKITTVGSVYMQGVINNLVYDDLDIDAGTNQQLIDMLAAYRTDLRNITTSGGNAWTTWTAADAINDYFFTSGGDGPVPDQNKFTLNGYPYMDEAKTKPLLKYLYNIDYDVATNFFFGMDIHMEFMQPKDGMTGKTGTEEMKFYFTGDDDIWVYIDGALFLDLTGIHRHVGGEIDFINGVVKYYALDDSGNGDVASTPYATYTFKELLEAAGKSTGNLNDKGTFADYTTHTFDFYYMERGSGSSVCRIEFNFPLLRKNHISVTKELTADSDINALGNPDFKFQIYKENGTELLVQPGTEYTIYDGNGNTVGTGTTIDNGVFSIKAGQTAVFGDILENSGKYFVRELFDEAVFTQYGTVTINGSSTTKDSYTNVTVGTDAFKGVDSPIKNMTDGSTEFIFNNNVDMYEYGSLEITKTYKDYSADAQAKSVTLEVQIDGVPIKEGTKYTVVSADGTESEGTVTADGVLTFRSDKTVIFRKILAGSVVTVREDNASSSGYDVEYSGSGFELQTYSDSGGAYAEGTVSAGDPSKIAITNDREGTKLTLTGNKTLLFPDGAEHSYDIVLREINSPDDNSFTDGGKYIKSKVTLSEGTKEFSLTLNYPPGTESGTYYYLVYEEGAAENIGYDSSQFIVAVNVDASGSTVTAETVSVTKDGEDADIAFINENLRSLSLTKQIEGASYADETFRFNIKASIDGVPLNGTYSAEGALTEITFENGEATVYLKRDETVRIIGLPYGTLWQIAEVDVSGYFVKYSVDSADVQTGDTAEGVLSGNSNVVFTNIVAYEMPSTGGINNLIYTFAGISLMVFSVVCGTVLRRKRERRYR